MNRTWLLWLAVLSACIISGCAIQTPKVSITGEKTALENQILGHYARLEEEVWMLVSYRSQDSTEQTFSQERRQILEAVRNRMFNKDDVEEFKVDGVVGEAMTGLLEIRSTKRYEQDDIFRRRVDTVVGEENHDRQVIMVRIVELETDLDTRESERIAEVFARLNQEGSPDGTWVEVSKGQWERK